MLSPPSRLTTLIFSSLTTLAGVVLVAVCALSTPFSWVLFGFASVCALAGVSGVIQAVRGRVEPLGLACVAGTIFVCAVLGYMGTNPPVVGGMSLLPWTIGLLALAGVLGGVAGLQVLHGDAAAWSRLIKGVLLGVPAIAMAGVLAVGSLRGPVLGFFTGLPVVIQALGVLIVFLLFTGLLASSVHLVIAAFSGPRKA